jgi:hypothetical protein
MINNSNDNNHNNDNNDNNNYHKYLKYKLKYLNLKKLSNSNYLNDSNIELKGGTKSIKSIKSNKLDRINKISINNFERQCKENNKDKGIDLNNKQIIISFIPKHFYFEKDREYEDKEILFEPIKSNKKNLQIMNDYIKSNFWKTYFIDYTFNDLRNFIYPEYNSEYYYVKDINTKIDTKDNNIMIIISGILQRYDYDEVKIRYEKEFKYCAHSKNCKTKWNDNPSHKLTVCDIYDFVVECMFKSTGEGEMIIPNSNIGNLNMGVDTEMIIDVLLD